VLLGCRVRLIATQSRPRPHHTQLRARRSHPRCVATSTRCRTALPRCWECAWRRRGEHHQVTHGYTSAPLGSERLPEALWWRAVVARRVIGRALPAAAQPARALARPSERVGAVLRELAGRCDSVAAAQTRSLRADPAHALQWGG